MPGEAPRKTHRVSLPEHQHQSRPVTLQPKAARAPGGPEGAVHGVAPNPHIPSLVRSVPVLWLLRQHGPALHDPGLLR